MIARHYSSLLLVLSPFSASSTERENTDEKTEKNNLKFQKIRFSMSDEFFDSNLFYWTNNILYFIWKILNFDFSSLLVLAARHRVDIEISGIGRKWREDEQPWRVMTKNHIYLLNIVYFSSNKKYLNQKPDRSSKNEHFLFSSFFGEKSSRTYSKKNLPKNWHFPKNYFSELQRDFPFKPFLLD